MTTVALALIGMGKMGCALKALAPERGFRVVAEIDAGEGRRNLGLARRGA